MRLTCLLPISLVLLGASCSNPRGNQQSSLVAKTQDNLASQHGLRIEVSGDSTNPEYWIVGGAKGRVRLPDLPHVEATTCPGPHFTISPDTEWIVADEKLWHGANEVWLLHRDASRNYSLVFPSFSRAAWKFYEQKSHKEYLDSEHYITRIGPWPTDNGLLHLTLYGGRDNDQRQAEVDIALSFDLKSRTFSISPDQRTTDY